MFVARVPPSWENFYTPAGVSVFTLSYTGIFRDVALSAACEQLQFYTVKYGMKHCGGTKEDTETQA